jgi:hypothetical protein
MKTLLKWSIGIFILVIVIAFLVFQFYLKQEPFADADDYWAQLERHQLTPDVEGHWNYTLGMIDAIAYSQKPYFPLPKEPYDKEMFSRWVERYGYDKERLKRVYYAFSNDMDYGWPSELQGVPWMLAIMGYVYAAPSVAIIEPGKTAEAAYVLRELINVLRSPAAWMDFSIKQGWGNPLIELAQWKGPLLITEGLYALVSGDKETFGPEIRAFAQDVYESQMRNLKLPYGKGFSGGIVCEPNQWFPQCNMMVILGLKLYDKVYGVDPKYKKSLGEEYLRNYMKFLKEYMTNPRTGMIYRRFHPYGPQQVDKGFSGFTNIYTILNLHPFAPEHTENIYRNITDRYIKRAPLGLGSFMLEIPERDIFQRMVNRGAGMPGMFGESALNLYFLWAATREFDDRKTFNEIHALLTNLTHPYYRQAEIRFDETNGDPTGLGDYTIGQILNMYSGWWLYAKTHVGWKTTLEYDWARNRDKYGHPLNDP